MEIPNMLFVHISCERVLGDPRFLALHSSMEVEHESVSRRVQVSCSAVGKLGSWWWAVEESTLCSAASGKQ